MSAPTANRSSAKPRNGSSRAGGGSLGEAEPERRSSEPGERRRQQLFQLAAPKRVPIGAVLSITQDGKGVALSRTPYDPRVVGVAAGHPSSNENPGTIYVVSGGQIDMLVNLDGGPIATGDLLVASTRPGVAMRARDRYRAIGAVIGKALQPFPWTDHAQEQEIRVLVTL